MNKFRASAVNRIFCAPAAMVAAAAVWLGGVGASPVQGQADPHDCFLVDGAWSFSGDAAAWLIEVTEHSIIQCTSFDIGEMQTVGYELGGQWRLLTYIPNDPDGTQIDGIINANGTVLFFNPAGVIFGGTATVNVGQIYAAAANLDLSDAAAIQAVRENVLDVNNTGTVTISNIVGNVTLEPGAQVSATTPIADRNAAHFLGQLVQNQGTINVASGGIMTMTAGNTVILSELGGNVTVQIPISAPPNASPGVVNGPSGSILATGAQVVLGAGDLYSLAVRHEGTLEAGQLTMQGPGFELLTDVTASEGAVFAGDALVSANVTAQQGIAFGGDVEFNGGNQAVDAGAGAELAFAGDVLKSSAGNLELTAGNVNFNNAAGDDQSLVVSDGILDINASVKKSTAGALDLSANQIQLSGASVSTTTGDLRLLGDVDFDGAGNQIVQAGGNAEIQFSDDAVKSMPGDLQLIAGNVNFNNGNGDDQSLVVSDGILDIDASVKKTSAGALDLGANQIELSGTSVSTTAGDLRLLGGVDFDGVGNQAALAGGNAEIQFSEDVTKSQAGDLRLIAGNVNFNNGAGADQSLVVSDGTLDIDASVKKTSAGALDLSANRIEVSGTSVSTTAGDLRLIGDVDFDGVGNQAALAGGNAEIQFSEDVTKSLAGDLRLIAGSVNFNNAAGDDQSLVVTDGTLDIDASVKKTSAGALDLNANQIELSGTSVTTTAGDLRLIGDVDLDGVGNQTMQAGGNAEIQFSEDVTKSLAGDLRLVAGNVNFNNAAGDDQSLVVTDGTLDIDASVKKTSAGALDLDANRIEVSGTSVSTTAGDLRLIGDVDLDGVGNQTMQAGGNADIQFSEDVTKSLAGDLRLIAGNVDFNNALGEDQSVDVAMGTLDIDANVVKSTAGDLSLDASEQIELTGNASTTGGDLEFAADTLLDGNLDQRVEAAGGALAFRDDLRKQGAGDITLAGSNGIVLDGEVTNEVGDLSVEDDVAVNGGAITTAGDQTFLGAVELGDDTTFAGLNVTFDSTVDSDGPGTPRALTVDTGPGGVTTFNGGVGQTNALGAIQTDADGSVVLAADVSTVGGVDFGGPVLLTGDVRMVDGSTAGLSFAGTIDGPFSLVVETGGNVLFGGDIGGTTALASLETVVDGVIVFDASFVQATGDIILNDGTLAAVPVQATIGATGDLSIVSTGGVFYMGQNQKLTVLGDLMIDAGTVTLGDVNSFGDMVVNADQIFILTRAPGQVSDGLGNLVNDFGVDLVTGGQFFFSVTPVAQGGGLVLFSSPNAEGDVLGTLKPFAMVSFGPTSSSQLRAGDGTFLDLSATGATNADLAQAFAGRFPREAQLEQVQQSVLPGLEARRRMIEDLYLPARDLRALEALSLPEGRGLYDDAPSPTVDPENTPLQIVINRFLRSEVVGALKSYDELVTEERPVERVRLILSDAWDAYLEADEDAEAAGFPSFLVTQNRRDELRILTQINRIFGYLDTMGPTSVEVQRTRMLFLSALKPADMTAEELQEILQIATRIMPN